MERLPRERWENSVIPAQAGIYERPLSAKSGRSLYAGKRQINTLNSQSIKAINPSNQSGLAPLINLLSGS